MECEHCKLVLKTKYILKTHLTSNKTCLKLRGLEMASQYTCSACNTPFISNLNLVNHQKICKLYKDIETLKELEEKYNNYEKIITTLKLQHQLENEKNEEIIKDLKFQNEKLLATIEKLASQAIDKTQTNITTTTNNSVRNNYSDKYFMETISEEFVKRKFLNHMTEQVLLEGQKGIARLCTEHNIKTPDNKVLLKCTDVSRKKFKHIDEHGNIKEDYDAREFTQRVFEPIKKITDNLYNTIMGDIEYEKQNTDQDDYKRRSQLRDREITVMDNYAQIICIDNPNLNGEFKTELAILNK